MPKPETQIQQSQLVQQESCRVPAPRRVLLFRSLQLSIDVRIRMYAKESVRRTEGFYHGAASECAGSDVLVEDCVGADTGRIGRFAFRVLEELD